MAYAINGKEEDKIDGLLTLVDNNQTSDSCRAYQCIKTLVAAANKSVAVKETLLQDPEKWQWAVNWLKEKMDGFNVTSSSSTSSGIGSSSTFGTSSTSDWLHSSATSNEDSLTRTFHRTTSAVVTLEEANALLAEFDRPRSSSDQSSSKTPPPSSPNSNPDDADTSGITMMDTEESEGKNSSNAEQEQGGDDEMPDLQEMSEKCT